MMRARVVRLAGGMASFAALGLSAGCGTAEVARKEACPPGSAGPACSESQEAYYAAYREILDSHGVTREPPPKGDLLPALKDLPKDHHGRVNWAKAIIDGFIRPKDSIEGKPVPPSMSEPFPNMIVFKVRAALMADVLFPHDIHNYWLDCNNCHPKIFKPKIGANPVTMQKIWQGEHCGRCHGKVAFSMNTETNCRRCHSLRKDL